MFPKKLRELLSGGSGSHARGRQNSQADANKRVGHFVPANGQSAQLQTRQSSGLDQFFQAIQDQMGLSILDLGGASQANISFITNLGHRVYSEDIVKAVLQAFPDGDQTNPDGIDQFLSNSFQFRDFEFDGALVWDTLQVLQPPLLQLVVDKLYATLRPNSCMLAFFNADEKAEYIPLNSYRIATSKQVQYALRGQYKAGQHFNNRSLERMFQRFGQLKFFLTRDHLREVIIRR